MARVSFPTAVPPYTGNISVLRGHLKEAASFCEKSPAAVPQVVAQINALLASLGYTASTLVPVT